MRINPNKISKEFFELLENLSEKQWKTKVNSNWTVKDVVAHLVGWEETAASELLKTWKTRKKPWFMESGDYREFNNNLIVKYSKYPTKELIGKWKHRQKVLDNEIKEIGEEKLREEPDLFSWVFDEEEDNHYLVHLNKIKKALN
jgi:hypothetical protein